jgi:hypothetical protein
LKNAGCADPSAERAFVRPDFAAEGDDMEHARIHAQNCICPRCRHIRAPADRDAQSRQRLNRGVTLFCLAAAAAAFAAIPGRALVTVLGRAAGLPF